MAQESTQPNRIAEAQRQYVAAAIPTAEQDIARAVEQARFEIIASIRDNVRRLSPERQAEIFADFEAAVKTGSIGYLADTITNWALGGRGYDYAGDTVNKSLDALPNLEDEPELLAAWQEYTRKPDSGG